MSRGLAKVFGILVATELIALAVVVAIVLHGDQRTEFPASGSGRLSDGGGDEVIRPGFGHVKIVGATEDGGRGRERRTRAKHPVQRGVSPASSRTGAALAAATPQKGYAGEIVPMGDTESRSTADAADMESSGLDGPESMQEEWDG